MPGPQEGQASLTVVRQGSGVGAITESDVNLASASSEQTATIIGFNVRASNKVKEMADRAGVEIRYYSVIYQAIEEIEAALKGLLKPEYEEVTLGSAEIREVFRSSKFGNIAGSIVRSGEIRRNTKARVLRGGKGIGEVLPRGKKEVARDRQFLGNRDRGQVAVATRNTLRLVTS